MIRIIRAKHPTMFLHPSKASLLKPPCWYTLPFWSFRVELYTWFTACRTMMWQTDRPSAWLFSQSLLFCLDHQRQKSSVLKMSMKTIGVLRSWQCVPLWSFQVTKTPVAAPYFCGQSKYIMILWVLRSANTVSLVPSSMSQHISWSCLLICLYRQQLISRVLSAINLAAAPAQLDQSPLFFVSVHKMSNCQLCFMLLESRYLDKTTHYKETHGLMSMGEWDLKTMLFRFWSSDEPLPAMAPSRFGYSNARLAIGEWSMTRNKIESRKEEVLVKDSIAARITSDITSSNFRLNKSSHNRHLRDTCRRVLHIVLHLSLDSKIKVELIYSENYDHLQKS